MKIALGQIDMVWEEKEQSFQKAEQMIKEAAKKRADVILFPEMAFTGFSMNIEKIAEPEQDSLTRQQMERFARQYHVAIGYGWVAQGKKADQKAKNCFTLLDKEGKDLAQYTKIHPFSYGKEDQYYQKGKEIVTVPFLGRTIGLFICYDLRFPEVFSIAAKKADIMFVIAEWPASRRDHWKTLLRARAIETQSYVVGVNCTGTHDGLEYSGDSMAVDAIGNVLGCLEEKEGVLICDLDDKAWILRGKFQTAKDRQEDFYMKHYEFATQES